jgi:hypothetical protein
MLFFTALRYWKEESTSKTIRNELNSRNFAKRLNLLNIFIAGLNRCLMSILLHHTKRAISQLIKTSILPLRSVFLVINTV